MSSNLKIEPKNPIQQEEWVECPLGRQKAVKKTEQRVIERKMIRNDQCGRQSIIFCSLRQSCVVRDIFQNVALAVYSWAKRTFLPSVHFMGDTNGAMIEQNPRHTDIVKSNISIVHLLRNRERYQLVWQLIKLSMYNLQFLEYTSVALRAEIAAQHTGRARDLIYCVYHQRLQRGKETRQRRSVRY